MSAEKSALQLVKGQDRYIKALPLEDGRLSFAVDTKKIYLDCDYEGIHDNEGTYQERLAFGGNSGIYYGVRSFTQDEIEASNYVFNFPFEFNGKVDEIPSLDDIIINTDGCFYRVIAVTPDTVDTSNTLIRTTKLTVAGSGGGGSGSTTGLIASIDPNQQYTIVAANKTIPIGFKVVDSIPDTSVRVEVSINNSYVGVFRNVTQNEYTSIDLYQYYTQDKFLINEENSITLRFVNNYNHAVQFTLDDVYIVDLHVDVSNANLGVTNEDQLTINVRPYGGSRMPEAYLNFELSIPYYANSVITQSPQLAKTMDNGNSYAHTVNLAEYGVDGSYTLEVWLSVVSTDGQTLTSPRTRVTWIYHSGESTTPLLSANINNTVFNQYDTGIISYTVDYIGTGTTVTITTYCNDEIISVDQQFAQFKQPYNYQVLLQQAGAYKFVVTLPDYTGVSTTIDNVTVNELEVDVPTIDTTDNALELYLTAQGRNNNELNPGTWSYKNINCIFDNFNWGTNGWRTDEDNMTSLHLSNGAKLTIPYAFFGSPAQNSGKTIEIIFKLSNVRDVNSLLINAASWDDQDTLITGIVGTGNKICMNTQNLTNYMTPEQEAAMTDLEREEYKTRNGLRAYLSEDTRIHVTFTIEPKDDEKRLIYTYVNGVLSGLAQYANNDKIEDLANHPSYMVIDSTYADIDIYTIRVYKKFCADSMILHNYAADLPTLEQKLYVKNNNDLLTDDEISLNRVMRLGNIPYIVFTDLRQTGSKKGVNTDAQGVETVGPVSGSDTHLPYTKEDFRWAPCFFVDPEDAKHVDDPNYIPRSFGSADNLVNAVIYAQGTSTLAYPVKNLRLRFVSKSDKYSLRPKIPYTSDEDAEKWEHLPKVALFTLKTDYMDSSLAHNTGTGNVLSALYDSIGLKTAAQIKYPEKTIVNNVVGFPCVAFYAPDGNSLARAQFIGRYNFNTDKDSKDDASLFGFSPSKEDKFGVLLDDQDNFKWGFSATLDEEYDENKTYYTEPILGSNNEPDPHYVYTGGSSGWNNQVRLTGPLYEYVEGPTTIQCWEFLNNFNALAGFREDYDEANDTGTWTKTSKGKTKTFGKAHWCDAFESRYPVYDTEVMSDKRAFKRLIHWLHTTDQSQATNETLTTPKYGFNVDSKEYRLAKFTQEFEDYMNLPFTTFYYILTEALLMVDSRAKNMMMCSFDIDSDAGTGHWFPIFYDMDTILGVDNSGILRFDYDVDDANEQGIYNAGANYGHYDDNNVWQPNGSYSTLWSNFREGFAETIATMYNNLRQQKFTYNFLTQSYNDALADAFAEVYNNKDGKYKYIRPLVEEVYIMKDGELVHEKVNMLSAEQGTRSLHRKYLLSHRLSLLDGKYSTGSNEDIEIHVNQAGVNNNIHPVPEDNTVFRPISQSTQYISVRLENNGALYKTYLKPGVRGATHLYPNANMNDAKFYVYNLGDIYDIGDFSNKFAAKLLFKHVNKLRTLKIGQADTVDAVSGDTIHYQAGKALNISGLSYCPMLETIDMQNVVLGQDGINTFTNDLPQLIYLHTVLAKGSNLNTYEFAKGGNVQHLELPDDTRAIYLRNNLFYNTIDHPENFQIENNDYSNIRTLLISGCPRVDTLSIMQHIYNSGSVPNYIRLPDIDWKLTPTEDNCVMETINEQTYVSDIKVLDLISRIPGGLDGTDAMNTVARQATNNEYFGGQLLINNDNCYINELSLKEKYSQMFPYLQITYTNPNNVVAGYDIVIHNMQGDPVYANTTTGKLNSITLDGVQAIGYNLKYYLEHDVTIPDTQITVAETYTFRGWNFTEVIKEAKDSVALDQALENGIPMEFDNELKAYVAHNCSTSLTANDFTDHQLHIYPIYETTPTLYTITFMATEQNESPAITWTTKEIPYGTQVTLPDTNLPAIINLNPDGDNDKSKTTIRLLDTYKFNNQEYSNFTVASNMTFYPVYSQAKYMNQLAGAEITESYFDSEVPAYPVLLTTSTYTDAQGQSHQISEGVTAVIRSDVTLPAICVPKTLGGKAVVSVRNESPYLQRLYFEEGCPIKYIAGANAGFNGSYFSKIGQAPYYRQATADDGHIIYVLDPNPEDENNAYKRQYEGFVKDGANVLFEYIDLAALTQLESLGTTGTGTGANDVNSRVFAYCPNLTISDLPHSLSVISEYTFAQDTSLDFAHLPYNILCISERAFDGCSGLHTVDFSPAFASATNNEILTAIIQNHNNTEGITVDKYWPMIGNYAFSKCTNLNLTRTVDNNVGEVTFSGVATIGTYAFSDCVSLKWTLDVNYNYDNSTILSINANAFSGCTSLGLTRLPSNLINIGNSAFANVGTAGLGKTLPILSNIPKSVRSVGSSIFSGVTLAANNDYHLYWRFPTDTISYDDDGVTREKSIVEVNSEALRNAKINRLTFVTDLADWNGDLQQAEGFVDAMQYNLPWTVAYQTSTKAFKASPATSNVSEVIVGGEVNQG